MPVNQFDVDKLELGWKVAMAIWLENREARQGFPAGPQAALEFVAGLAQWTL
jgi:hypothetical protein